MRYVHQVLDSNSGCRSCDAVGKLVFQETKYNERGVDMRKGFLTPILAAVGLALLMYWIGRQA